MVIFHVVKSVMYVNFIMSSGIDSQKYKRRLFQPNLYTLRWSSDIDIFHWQVGIQGLLCYSKRVRSQKGRLLPGVFRLLLSMDWRALAEILAGFFLLILASHPGWSPCETPYKLHSQECFLVRHVALVQHARTNGNIQLLWCKRRFPVKQDKQNTRNYFQPWKWKVMYCITMG